MPDKIETSSISIIIVAYYSLDMLLRLQKTIPDGHEVIVVDNGEDDGFRALAHELGIKLLVPETNLGFGAACNLGARHATGELMLFLNPDTRLYPDTLNHFFLASQTYPQASAFGACLEYENGDVSPSSRNLLIRDTDPTQLGYHLQDSEVPMIVGAALMVRRKAFEEVDGFDEEIFLYREDDELCLRLQKEQGPLMFVANARVVHFEGNSSAPSMKTERLKGYHSYRSQVYVLRKHGIPNARRKAFIELTEFALSWKMLWSNQYRNQVVGRLKAMLDGFIR